ncbi:hypothetical protein [Paractinoplanes lichenicola]|uniref:Uncharacterized protein n=1 Tax=Paractinoplanes lichenicola TaxID=2802976 RepID=A0ABS1VL41_9ACTN|nr:hypothetical protein [Actinoplanes lichenicola]MBL7254206.1 hypothetical protein [Actinoplanes lichenicola]
MSVRTVRRRIGWLLKVNRKLGADEELRIAKNFARAWPGGGHTPDAPTVSRWESGKTAISTATVNRYEGLLGLELGCLTALKHAIERAAGTASGPGATAVDDDKRLHELLERSAGKDEMGGPSWIELSDHVRAAPDLRLHPPRLWDAVSDRLLGELVVAEHCGWLQRQEALSRLLEHRWAGASAIGACIDLAEDSTPVVIEPLSLLDSSPDLVAGRYIRQAVESPASDRALVGALLAASRKIRRRHFTHEDSSRIGRAVTSLLNDSTLDEGLRRLASEVESELRAGGATRADAASVWATSSRPRRISTRACARVSPAGPSTDEMLTELVGQALYDPNPDDRMLAAMFIAGTPVRAAVASCLLVEIEEDLRRRRHCDLGVLLRTMTLLRSGNHRPVLHRILTDPHAEESARLAAAWALPHCAEGPAVTPWSKILEVQTRLARRPSMIGASVLHGVVYGAGTDGDEATLRRVRADSDLPTIVRSTARWLLTARLPVRSLRHSGHL